MSTALVPANQTAALDAAYQPRTLDEAKALATSFARSGLLTAKIDTPEKAFTIMATGAEIGMSPMAALRSIYIVEGKPTLSADAMVAIVKRSALCLVWQLVHSDDERATYRTQRKGEQPVEMSFTMLDAKRAGLASKSGPWQQYPAKMLRHRAASNLAREVYPDLLAGLYDPDEVEVMPIAATIVEPLAQAQAAPADKPAKRAKPDPAPEIVSSSIDWTARLTGASDLAELRAIAAEAARAQMPDDVRAAATAAFKARKAELAAPAPEPAHDAVTGETVEG